GVKRKGQPDAITNDSRFRVASLSKMLVSAAALSLADEQRIDLHAAVTNYIPSWHLAQGSNPASVTLDDLLSHASGLADLRISFLNCPASPSLSAWFASDTKSPLWTPPRAVWNYSNRGYSVAGWAVESVAGVPFERVITDRVLSKAGM